MPKIDAMVLAMFGTALEEALPGLLHVRDLFAAELPGMPLRLCFTSATIRSIWRQRAADASRREDRQAVDPAILDIQGPLATVANLQDRGCTTIVVQPVQIAPGEEYVDLCHCLGALAGIRTIKPGHRPFRVLAVGRPALGGFGADHPYGTDISAAAAALAGDVRLAEAAGAALLYMGHGNRHFPSAAPYLELAARMGALYPGTRTYIGLVEGFPGPESVIADLRRDGVDRVVLKPLLVAAGHHAVRDMVGDGPDSWKSRLIAAGIEVVPILRGLGEQEAFARIFVEHARDAARDAGVTLD